MSQRIAIACAGLVLASAAFAEERVVVRFDDQTQPSFFAGSRPVTDELASLGLHFRGPAANDGGAILNQDGNFGVLGHSSPNFLAFNSGTTYPTGGRPRGPETLVFDEAVEDVRIMVGSGLAGRATMTCFGQGGGQLGRAEVVVAAQMTQLAVNAIGIASCALDMTSTYGVFDDLSFVKSREHQCLFGADDRVKCWGGNSHGQLGLGDKLTRGDEPGEVAALTGIDLGAGFAAKLVRTGNGFSCALAVDGRVKCWGTNNLGQLGIGDKLDRGDDAGEMGDALPALDFGGIAVRDLSLGASHGCALMVDDSVRCWGFGAGGQLGQGNVNSLGDDTGEKPAAVDLGVGARVTQLALGKGHSCALLTQAQGQASVKCWGEAGQGQLGSGASTPLGTAAGQMGEALRPVALGAGFTPLVLTAGAAHSCVLSVEGEVKCFGANDRGQLGLGLTRASVGAAADQMGEQLPRLDLGSGQFVTDLVCRASHCCSTFVQKTMKCWGDNGHGQLGLGDTRVRGQQPTQMGNELDFVPLRAGALVEAVTLANTASCARTQQGWFCWGANSDGQLGTGDVLPRGGSLDTLPDTLEPLPL